MAPKADTPIKNTSKPVLSRFASASIFNEDLMAALKAFKVEVLSSSKALSDLQETQYNDLKTGLSLIFSQMAELKAENSKLCSQIDVLKGKVANLENSCSDVQSQSVVTRVL